MNYKFNARHIFINRDSGTEVLGFADDEFSPSKYVVLQRSISNTEGEQALGMDAVHIQIEDESRSKYGGIAAIRISNEKILISLNIQTQNALQIAGDIEVIITPDNSHFEAAASFLKSMCMHGEITSIDDRV